MFSSIVWEEIEAEHRLAIDRLDSLRMPIENGDDEVIKEFWRGYNDALWDAKIIVGNKHEPTECGNMHCQSETKFYHCRLCIVIDEDTGWPCKYVKEQSSE